MDCEHFVEGLKRNKISNGALLGVKLVKNFIFKIISKSKTSYWSSKVEFLASFKMASIAVEFENSMDRSHRLTQIISIKDCLNAYPHVQIWQIHFFVIFETFLVILQSENNLMILIKIFPGMLLHNTQTYIFSCYDDWLQRDLFSLGICHAWRDKLR